MSDSLLIEYLERCKKALADIAALPPNSDLRDFERSSGFALNILFTPRSYGPAARVERAEALRTLIERDVTAFELLRAELARCETGEQPNPCAGGNLAHYLAVRECGRRGRQVLGAGADVRTKMMVLLTGAGDDGLFHRWRQFHHGPMDLTGADFSGLAFGQANFDDAILRSAHCRNAAFVRCSFNNANADGADFSHALFFTFIKMKGAVFTRCNFSGATLADVEVDQRTDFADAVFADCTIKKASSMDPSGAVARLKGLLSVEQRKQLRAPWFVRMFRGK